MTEESLDKNDFLFVSKLCKDAIEKAQPDVHPYMHELVEGRIWDTKRALERAYKMIENAEAGYDQDPKYAEALLNQTVGIMNAHGVLLQATEEQILLSMPTEGRPS